jgi:hypothetical protein
MSIEKNLGVVACTCHPINDGKSNIEGSWSRQNWAKKRDTISKMTIAGGVAQAVTTHLAYVKP